MSGEIGALRVQVNGLKEAVLRQQLTMDAYRWLIEDLLALAAAKEPNPGSFVDETLLRFHGTLDQASDIMAAVGASGPEEPAKRALKDRAMLVARMEYDRIFENVRKRVRDSQQG